MNALITLFKSILEISLFASAMIVVVLFIKKIAGDRINLKMVSFLWLLVILRLCLPGMMESPVHVEDLFPPLAQVREVADQPVSRNEDTGYYQNNAFKDQPSVNEAVAPVEAIQPNQTAAEPRKVTSTFYGRALTFLQSLDLWLIAAIVWLTGGAIVLASVLKENIAFGLHVRKSSRPLTDPETLGIVAAHKAANHLRRNIRVSVCPTIQMPLAFGVLRPHILLPLRITEELSREHLEAILLHEVCHIKRNDILKSYACVLAKGLHWFNPFVWISVKQIKTDMELACDQRVLTLMKAGQEVAYCESLLAATRFMKQSKVPQFVASLCESRSNLKERILKIVAPQKKSRSAVVISIALALVMFTAFFTTACQPTPENPVVVGRQEDVLANVPASAGFEPIAAPAHVTEHTTTIASSAFAWTPTWSCRTCPRIR